MTMWIATMLFAAATLAPPESPPVSTAPEPPAQIMAVSPELRAQLQDRLSRSGPSQQQKLQGIVDFIFQRDGIALTYDDTKTRTVDEVYRTGKANCLSFTLLFLALSREAGFDSRAQEVGQVLAWHEEANIFYTSGHINAGLRINGNKWTADLDRSVLFAPKSPKVIDDRRLFAHFYNNRGVELMAAGHPDAAEEHLNKAIAMAPDLAEAWNSLGVLTARGGNPEAALRYYKTALEQERGNAAALSNLVSLYQRTGDARNAAVYMLQLQRIRSRDPFLQYILAGEAERSRRYENAAAHYRRAIRLYDDAHQFHFGLARVYFLQGKNLSAQHELTRAMQLGRGDQALERRYAAKLASLRQWSRSEASRAGSAERIMR